MTVLCINTCKTEQHVLQVESIDINIILISVCFEIDFTELFQKCLHVF